MAIPNESVRSRTRAAILDAASALFREDGFDRTSMDEIAKRASVARGTLYYNFASKDDIAIGIAERHRTAGYAQLLERKAAGANALTLLDEFFAFAGAWIARNRDAAFIGTTAAMRGIGRSPDRPGTTAVFEEVVRQGQEEGLIRPDIEPTVAARLLGALLTQAALLGPDPSNEDDTRWPLQLLRVALAGLLAEDGSPLPIPSGRPDATRVSRRAAPASGEAVP